MLKKLRNITISLFILNAVLRLMTVVVNMIIERTGNMSTLVHWNFISSWMLTVTTLLILIILIVDAIYLIATKTKNSKSFIYAIIGLLIYATYLISLNTLIPIIYSIIEGGSEYSVKALIQSESYNTIITIKAGISLGLYVTSLVFTVLGLRKPRLQNETIQLEIT